MLKYAILGFLSYKPMTGYEIKQRMDRSTTHFWHAKLSQIYTTLGCLEKEKAVVSSIQEQDGRPDKRLYNITEPGHIEFTEWLNQPYTDLSPKKEPLVLKMFFAARMDRMAAITQLRIQLDIHQRQLEKYRTTILEDVQNAREEFPELTADADMWEATRRFGELYEETYVRWLNEMMENLSSRN